MQREVTWALKRVLGMLQVGPRGCGGETVENLALGGVCLRELGSGLLSSESVGGALCQQEG